LLVNKFDIVKTEIEQIYVELAKNQTNFSEFALLM